MMTIRPEAMAGPCIVDRGWSLRLGPLQVDRWTRIYAGDPSRTERLPHRRSSVLNGRVALAASGLCLLAVVATGIAAERVGAERMLARPGYALTIVVPPTVRRADRSTGTPRARAGDGRVHAARDIVQDRPVIAAVPDRPPVFASGENLPDPMIVSTATRADALQAALATGEMQEWVEPASGVHGFVVAGPIREDAGRQCRAVSVTTRASSADVRVEQRQECTG